MEMVIEWSGDLVAHGEKWFVTAATRRNKKKERNQVYLGVDNVLKDGSAPNATVP